MNTLDSPVLVREPGIPHIRLHGHEKRTVELNEQDRFDLARQGEENRDERLPFDIEHDRAAFLGQEIALKLQVATTKIMNGPDDGGIVWRPELLTIEGPQGGDLLGQGT